MNNENYIVINGKKTELTEEQLEQLGIKVKKERDNPFGGITDKHYYFISNVGNINYTHNIGSDVDDGLYNNANWFKDEAFANQVMLHQLLYRKLLKYAYDNNAEVANEDWKGSCCKYYIYYIHTSQRFYIGTKIHVQVAATVHFNRPTVAENAIKYIIEPFMKEHPEFVW